MKRPGKPKDVIMELVRAHGVVTSQDVVRRLRISRQTATEHLRHLIAAHRLVRLGSTRGARYIPAGPSHARKGAADHFRAVYKNRGLEEDRVLSEVELRLALPRKLSGQARRIVAYAFTEMLNNAIEHSHAGHSEVAVRMDPSNFEFAVVDRGIGVFDSIRRKFRLKDRFEAVEHVLKGKQTTDPERHSGQGIFFTSKIADRFVLESGGLSLVMDNVENDIALKDIKAFKGTRVYFRIKRKSRKDLKAVFDQYSNAEYEFDRTKVYVRLSQRKDEVISRSQARRLLFGLERFKRITLDFSGVSGVGQGFVDEIFRVFRTRHPDIEIEAVNMQPSVRFMVERT
jgi:anti-sigma regulatory factor (Ser/Thr protein kinase)